jgi:hypothetical protein
MKHEKGENLFIFLCIARDIIVFLPALKEAGQANTYKRAS